MRKPAKSTLRRPRTVTCRRRLSTFFLEFRLLFYRRSARCDANRGPAGGTLARGRDDSNL